MYRKPPGNPKVTELNKTYRERSYNLSFLDAIKVEVEGQKKPDRFCAWCAVGKLSHGNQKYCSNDCSTSAMAWAYPQKEDALGLLLVAQGMKCRLCGFDYTPEMEAIRVREKFPYNKDAPYPWYYYKRLKTRVPRERRPEVDHIVPIYKGGQSIGLENHQAICYTCHKEKTRKDNSGSRKK